MKLNKEQVSALTSRIYHELVDSFNTKEKTKKDFLFRQFYSTR